MGGDGVAATGVSTGLSSEDEQAVVEALAFSTVEEVAPEEAPLFGPMSEAYFDPARSGVKGSDSDEMLGFGVDAAAAMVLVTPVALEAARSVIVYVVGELQTAFKDEAKPMIAAFVKRLLHGKEKPGATPGAEARRRGRQGRAQATRRGARAVHGAAARRGPQGRPAHR